MCARVIVIIHARMDHFLYRDGALYAEDVLLSEIAASVGHAVLCLFHGDFGAAFQAV